MPVSIGIDYTFTRWMCCVRDADTIIDSFACNDLEAFSHYLAQTCNLYPEAQLMLASPLAVPEMSLHTYLEQQERPSGSLTGDMERLQCFLSTISEFSLRTNIAPAVQFLPHIPPHRRLLRADLGSANIFCMLVTLLAFMRQQQADWIEMNFTLLVLEPTGYRFLVVKQGQVVDGRSAWQLPDIARLAADRQLVKEALLEQLSGDLASIMAVHQLEDVVLLTQPIELPRGISAHGVEGLTCSTEGLTVEEADAFHLMVYRDVIIEHFAELYQFFLYPGSESGEAGFAAAQGAALLADGLTAHGPASELRAHLFAMTTHA